MRGGFGGKVVFVLGSTAPLVEQALDNLASSVRGAARLCGSDGFQLGGAVIWQIE
jgi:hypothetical protein